MDAEQRAGLRMLTPLRRQTDAAHKRVRRGVYLLPSLFTMGNMFCGYCCIVYAIRGEFERAAVLIGVAMVLDMLDGRVARMTGGDSEFGVQFDSLADVVSFGMAPGLLSFLWGLQPLGRIGWAASFVFAAAAAVRLARFNIQSGSQDKRYFVGLPSPAAAAVAGAPLHPDPRYY
jgi:CDP-diacylglycerol--serine O-phosphatidyltransferase